MLSPLSEPERLVHRSQRQDEYPIPLVIGALESLRKKENQELETLTDEIKLRDVGIPRPTNVSSSIRKPEAGGRFQLKQSMVQILHTNGQFTGVFDMRILQFTLRTFSRSVRLTLQLE